jgi:DNA-binding GntR family transcriptional regulator
LPAASRVIVKRANTAERVAVALRTAIARGELVAGAHVRQEEWAQRLSVSRAPAREAMKMLVSEHLLTYDTHRGYFVNDVDPKQMADVYLVRTLLEAEVLKTIRWPTEEELAALRKLAHETVDLLTNASIHDALDVAQSLQFAIYDLSNRGFLVSEVKRYWGIAELYRALSMGDEAADRPAAKRLRAYHRELFAALESRDRERLIAHNTSWRSTILKRYGPAT